MKQEYNNCLISVDIGTTRSKALLHNGSTGIVKLEEESYPTYYPHSGFVEQNPDEVFTAVLKVIRRLMDNVSINPKKINAICFDGVWQSLLPVDKEGNILHNALLWSDTRSSEYNKILMSELNVEELRHRTGCGLHPIYFPSRLLWIKKELSEIFKRTFRFISIKEYIINHLFGVYKVDHSTASGTGIWNMEEKNWDLKLLSDLDIRPDYFSECVEPTSFISGGLKKKYASILGLVEGTKGIIGASDGAVSHIGSAGIDTGKMSLTIGTGAAMRKSIHSPQLRKDSEAYCYYLADDIWLSGGILLNAGNVFRWFADNIMPVSKNIGDTFKQMDNLAADTQAGADGLFFIPLLSGERCPWNRPDTRGVIFGLNLAHSKGHLVRSLMEGLSYNIYSVYKMLSNSEQDLVVGGGVLNSPVWLRIITDFIGKRMWLPGIREVAAWGGVILGLRTLGVINDLKESIKFIDLVEKYEPDPENHNFYLKLINNYELLNKEIYKYENKIKYK